MSAGVYAIINTINNFIYIGSFGNQGFTKRINMHKNHLRKNKHHSWILQRDWNKYGENAFIFTLIELCTIKQSKLLEQKLINQNGTGIKDKSYNILDRVDRKSLPKNVSNKIKNAHRNPNLIINTNTSGYKGVCLYRNKWKASIGRYGKSYHIGYYETVEEANLAYQKINKLNDKEFYKWWNKEYNTNRKNYRYLARGEDCTYAKLTQKDVNKIRKMYKTGKYTQKELGNKFKVDPSLISRIYNNKYWK